jgi:hypothetical protein
MACGALFWLNHAVGIDLGDLQLETSLRLPHKHFVVTGISLIEGSEIGVKMCLIALPVEHVAIHFLFNVTEEVLV